MGSMVFLHVMEASPPETKSKKKISMVYDKRSENDLVKIWRKRTKCIEDCS